MKNPFSSPSLAIGLAVTGIVQLAQAQVLGIDPILTGSSPAAGEYAVASIIGQNPVVSGFTGAWADFGGSATATGLTYSAPNYLAASGGAIEHTGSGRPYRSMDTALASAFSSEGTVYWSFLAKFGTTGDNSAWGGYAAVEVGTNGSNDNGKALAIGIDGGVAGNFMYQINNGTKTSLGIASDTNTHLFLVRFDLSATAASDSVTMWIDPDLSGGVASDPSGGVAVGGLELFSITNFRFGAGGANSFADEIRFGTTLESVIVEPSVPVFVTHPADYFGSVGDDVTLSVSATADPEPSYQWEYSDDGSDPWAPVGGATSSVLQIPDAPFTANGYYRAVATNTNDSSTSNAALVSLSYPVPTITLQPSSVYAVEGTPVELSVTATGIGTLTYQWFKNTFELSGETSATLSLGNVDAGDAGEYYVEVTDHAAEESGEAATVATSATAVVGILDSPALASEPFAIGADPSSGHYAEASIIGQNPVVSGFTGAWADFGGSATASGLTYSAPNYLAASGGAIEHTGSGRPYRAMDAPLATTFAGTGTVYWSFLAKFGTTGDNSAWGGYAAVEVGTNGTNDNGKALAIGIDGGGVAGNFMYQINNGTKTSLGTASDTNTHLFLVRFDLSATAASDSVTMWIDPDLSGGLASDPSGGVAVGGLDLFSITNFRFGAGGANSFADEIRFGTTLGSVIAPELPSTTFASWIAGYDVNGQTGFDDDADSDGIKNGLENVFGTDPSVPNQGITAVAKTGNTITFQHPQSGAPASDVAAAYKWSTDLANFHASGAASGGTTVTISAALNTPVAGTTTVSATISGTQPAKLFVVLEATAP